MKHKNIKYKVVCVEEDGTRCSALAWGYFKRVYPKGAVVKKCNLTSGIFVFNTEQAARDFMGDRHDQTIIKVSPIGDRVYSFKFVQWICLHKTIIRNTIPARWQDYTPPGTEVYAAVKVLT